MCMNTGNGTHQVLFSTKLVHHSCQAMFVRWLLNVPVTCKVRLKDRPTQMIVCTATLRQELHIKLAISCSHSTLRLGQPVLALTLKCQEPDRVASGKPSCKSLVRLDRGK